MPATDRNQQSVLNRQDILTLAAMVQLLQNEIHQLRQEQGLLHKELGLKLDPPPDQPPAPWGIQKSNQTFESWLDQLPQRPKNAALSALPPDLTTWQVLLDSLQQSLTPALRHVSQGPGLAEEGATFAANPFANVVDAALLTALDRLSAESPTTDNQPPADP